MMSNPYLLLNEGKCATSGQNSSKSIIDMMTHDIKQGGNNAKKSEMIVVGCCDAIKVVFDILPEEIEHWG